MLGCPYLTPCLPLCFPSHSEVRWSIRLKPVAVFIIKSLVCTTDMLACYIFFQLDPEAIIHEHRVGLIFPAEGSNTLEKVRMCAK